MTMRVLELADGTRILRVPHGHERPYTFLGSHCPQCGVRRGHHHDPGCPLEECPACRQRLAECDCLLPTGPVSETPGCQGEAPRPAGNSSAKGGDSRFGHPPDGFWDGVS